MGIHIKRIGHVGLLVEDFERSFRFYPMSRVVLYLELEAFGWGCSTRCPTTGHSLFFAFPGISVRFTP